jgi:hypothetical protein
LGQQVWPLAQQVLPKPLQQVVPPEQQTALPALATPQISPSGQHWPPMQEDPLAQVPQSTAWPQLFVTVPQVAVPQVVALLFGVQQVPLAVHTSPPLQQVWPHPQSVERPPGIVCPTVQAATQAPPQQKPPEQQSAVSVQTAPMGLQAAWQVPFTQKPEQQSVSA